MKKQVAWESPLIALRGAASIVVLVFHFLSAYTPSVYYGYGYVHRDGDQSFPQRSLLQLPMIRVIYAGPAMVYVHYVLSAYAFSMQPIIFRREDKLDQMLVTLSHKSFKRSIRFFLPAIVSTYVVALLAWLGTFEFVRSRVQKIGNSRLQLVVLPPKVDGGFYAQTVHWLGATCTMLNPYRWERDLNPYNNHLWTLPFEFRNGVILVFVMITLARVRSQFRFITLGLLFLSTVLYGRLDVSAAIGGNVLAELKLRSLSSEATPKKNSPGKHYDMYCLVIFITGIYLLSYPKVGGEGALGFQALATLTLGFDNAGRFWQLVGSILVIHSIVNLGFLPNVVELHSVQAIGKHASSIYLVHGPFLQIFGLLTMSLFWNVIRHESFVETAYGFGITAATAAPALYLAVTLFRSKVELRVNKLIEYIQLHVIF